MIVFPNQLIIHNLKVSNLSTIGGKVFKWDKFEIIINENFQSNLIINEKYIFYGEIFSFENFNFNSNEILNSINWQSSLEVILGEISKISGYFTLLLNQNTKLVLLNDASGQYECYYFNNNEKTLISNQPHYIKELLSDNELEFNNEIPNYILEKKENILNYSVFKNIFKIIPNHFLDIKENLQVRFYPNKELKWKNIDEIAKECSLILKETLKSMSNRRELAIGLTAGWDSKVLLSACKDVITSTSLYTLDYENETSSTDINIASKIAKSINKKLEIINTSVIGEKNILWEGAFHDDEKLHTSSILKDKEKFDNYYIVNGNISEIARNFYLPLPKIKSANDLCYISKFKENKYEVEKFEDWFRSFKSLSKLNYSILDFLYWEHKMSNWAGRGKSISNMYQINISPFNNRYLLDLMLSVKGKYRDKHNNILYKKIIEILWKELNEFPINPTKKGDKIKFLKRIKLYSIYRSIFFKLRKLKF